MDRKILTAAVILAMAAVCLVPAAADASDGEQTELRFSEYYLLKGVYVAEEDLRVYSSSTSVIVYVDGSPDDLNMERYISDPMHNDITSRGILGGDVIEAGTTLNVYFTSYFVEDYAYFNNIRIEGTAVMDPYGERDRTMFVKAGDTVTIRADARNYLGESVDTELRSTNGYWYDMEDGYFSQTFDTSVSLIVSASSYRFYCDMSLSIDGASTPNGSPAIYFAVCAAITLIVLALMILAAIKPGWSK